MSGIMLNEGFKVVAVEGKVNGGFTSIQNMDNVSLTVTVPI
jgi:hypothetical protein